MARPTGTGTLRDKNLKRLFYTSERYLTGYRSMMRFIPRSDSPKKVASGHIRVNADTQTLRDKILRDGTANMRTGMARSRWCKAREKVETYPALLIWL